MNYLSRGLFILVSLIAFSSCEKTDTIGLDPNDTLKSNYIEDFNVSTVTVREDSVLATNQPQFPLGSITDPALGRTDAAMAMGLALPSSAVSFGSTASLDSGVLVLKYGKGFFGDSTNTTYNVTVHQLKENYISTSSYYTNRKWNYDSTNVVGQLANVNRFRWNDSIRVTQIVKGGRDTLQKVVPQIRIKMSAEFMRTYFLNAGSDKFANAAAFQNHIKGLYVKVRKEQPDGRGGIAYFDLASAGVSGLEVYYKSTTGSTVDTNKVVFGLGQTTTAAAIKHNYTTAVQTQLNNPQQSYSTVFAQPLAGLRTKVTFTNLDAIRALGNVAINKAELVVYVEPGSESIFKPVPRLNLYRTDIAGQRQAADQVSFLGSPYDKDKKRYAFNISSYIQNLVNGKDKQYSTYLAPIDENFLNTQSANIAPVLTTAARSVLAGNNHVNSKIKLNIYYTKPD